MTPAQTYNQEQRDRWNGDDGQDWVRLQDRLDQTLAVITGPLLDLAAPREGSTVIDIGCGCGGSTIELARRVGPSGRIVALDVSGPMLGVAKERLREFGNATCLLGDAAELTLAGLNADLAISRFGVMFFGDPAAAFGNIRTGLATGGRLRFVCWRPISENAWLQVPLHAAYEHAPRLPKPDPEEPGPFSFANPERVTRILTTAGFTSPSFTSLDVEIDISSGGGLDEAVAQSAQMGPAKRALKDQPDEIRAAALGSIRKALAPFATTGAVKLAGAAWLVAADRR